MYGREFDCAYLASDERILGKKEFIQRVLSEAALTLNQTGFLTLTRILFLSFVRDVSMMVILESHGCFGRAA